MFINLVFVTSCHYQVDEKSEQHGGEIIGQVLKAHGVEHIFTLQNKSVAPICKGAEKNGIKVITTKHEVTSVAAADANSRITGLPGVVLMTGAPGINNTLAAIKAASAAESALLIIGCSSGNIMKEEHLEVTNQMKQLKPIVKWTGKVSRVRDIAYDLREALRQALHGTPGPVYIQFTLDCLNTFPTVKKELEKRTSNWYLDYYIQNLFAAGFDVGREIRPWPIEIPFPKKDQVQLVVKSITKASRPLIIMGSQSTLPPIEDTKISTIIQDMGIPCFLQGTARTVLSRTNKLYIKHGLTDALSEADLVLVLGVAPEFKAHKLPSKTQLFIVNRNKSTLKANRSSFGDHGTVINSDVGQFLVELSEKVGRINVSQMWIDDLNRKSAEGDSAARTESKVGPVLEEVVPDSSVIISDGGSLSKSVEPILQSKGAWIEASPIAKATALAGYAIGTKLGKREATVVSLIDSSNCSYLLSETVTCVTHGIPLVAVIGNEDSTGKLLANDPSLNGPISLESVDSTGGKSVTLDGKDVRSLKTGLEKAFALTNEGSSVLVNLKI